MPRLNEPRRWVEIVADVGRRIAPWAAPREQEPEGPSGAVRDALEARRIRRR